MKKKTQDLAWACLPKEARLGIVQLYVDFQAESKGDYINRPFWVGLIRKFESIFGEHNLTSDAEPSELAFIERSVLIDRYSSYSKESDTVKNNEPYLQFCEGRLNALANLFGDKCLPDTTVAEDATVSNEQPSVQGEPKLDILPCRGERLTITNKTNDRLAMSIGDKFTVISSWKGTMQSVAHRIYLRIRQDNGYVRVINSDKYSWKPYTEPETKDTKLSTQAPKLSTLEPKLSTETKDNMKEKELNLCELLKGCEGESFFSPTFGDIRLDIIDKDYIDMVSDEDSVSYKIFANGTYTKNGKICLYPSRTLYEKYPLDAYSAWMAWKEARKPKRWRAEKGDRYWWIDFGCEVLYDYDIRDDGDNLCYENFNYFRTEKEAKQAAEGVREYLQKFHEKNSEK